MIFYLHSCIVRIVSFWAANFRWPQKQLAPLSKCHSISMIFATDFMFIFLLINQFSLLVFEFYCSRYTQFSFIVWFTFITFNLILMAISFFFIFFFWFFFRSLITVFFVKCWNPLMDRSHEGKRKSALLLVTLTHIEMERKFLDKLYACVAMIVYKNRFCL